MIDKDAELKAVKELNDKLQIRVEALHAEASALCAKTLSNNLVTHQAHVLCLILSHDNEKGLAVNLSATAEEMLPIFLQVLQDRVEANAQNAQGSLTVLELH